jgi:hypothetical protein
MSESTGNTKETSDSSGAIDGLATSFAGVKLGGGVAPASESSDKSSLLDCCKAAEKLFTCGECEKKMCEECNHNEGCYVCEKEFCDDCVAEEIMVMDSRAKRILCVNCFIEAADSLFASKRLAASGKR